MPDLTSRHESPPPALSFNVACLSHCAGVLSFLVLTGLITLPSIIKTARESARPTSSAGVGLGAIRAIVKRAVRGCSQVGERPPREL